MGKICISILFIFTCKLVLAQDKILFSHDDSGNRIQRLFQGGSLPVVLISFNAYKNPEGSTALLTWQTSSEINSDRFEVERSKEGKKWFVIGNVAADGEYKANPSYSFLDKSPMDGENLYRLKMIDKDGTFALSRIESLNFDLDISFYPNPVSHVLKVKGLSQTQSLIKRIEVLNNYGTVVISRLYFPVEGINVRSLPTGIYIVKTYHNDGSSTVRKVIKE